jgi:predicted dehydrogenase
MRNPKSIGLLGCGLWGQNILRELLALGARVVVVDPSAEVRSRVVSEGAANALAEVGSLPDVDAIVVATPATTHSQVIETVLGRHVPIFCEKPFTTDLESASRLAQADSRIFVMHLWRYHPGVEALAALARSGDLGPVTWLRTTRLNWVSPRRDIDCIWTLAPHDLSIAQEILGRIPPPRLAVAERLGSVPVGMIGVLEDGVRFVFEVSCRYADKRREVRMHCRDGIAVLPHAEADFIEISRHRDNAPHSVRMPISTETPLRRELQAFLGYLDGGEPPRTSAVESVAIVAALLQLRQLASIDAPCEGLTP